MTGLAAGGIPLRATYSQPPFAGTALQAIVPAGNYRPYGLAVVDRARGRLLPPVPYGLALAAAGHPLIGGLGRGLAVGGRLCMGAGRSWPPLLLAAFATKMQQERVEQFYVIQSHHT
ncbi:hypothetical protein GW17_00046481 [Ensete ventricosum]|nr:hypothetical protein GW17_00046481 [Ensete ventricosum]RZS16630.1 hypothetical protein BHM03_00048654 [Ensete ventricosum]